jgi:hypothetical protein
LVVVVVVLFMVATEVRLLTAILVKQSRRRRDMKLSP